MAGTVPDLGFLTNLRILSFSDNDLVSPLPSMPMESLTSCVLSKLCILLCIQKGLRAILMLHYCIFCCHHQLETYSMLMIPTWESARLRVVAISIQSPHGMFCLLLLQSIHIEVLTGSCGRQTIVSVPYSSAR